MYVRLGNILKINMTRLENLLPLSEKFLRETNFVKISENIPEELKIKLLTEPDSEPLVQFEGLSPVFFLLIDSLNFCFWNADESKTFRYGELKGSIALGMKIKEVIKKYPDLADKLSNDPSGFMKELLLGTTGQMQLVEERVRILGDIGIFLKETDFEKLVTEFNGKSVNDFANFMLEKLPYVFSDIVNFNGVMMPFCKKLRLLISDLEAFCGMNLKDREDLLIYPDHKLPQLFINYGMLIPRSDLLQKLKDKEVLGYGSEEEAALRAGAIICASKIAESTGISYPDLDYRLWVYSKEMNPKVPHHRTISRFY
ncbi:MAG: hypothetical protein COU07_02740 [Candidatus Harrisonbacteria bacterium CG10_big_fil_rev_8_21_14_0_10_40_38]|uniref:Queuosine 5'-phosphate N-glycosylase/hydrolase n=1 Tax=Candidatus Harrisonbacteria bacterium CG10_big_fil_rev_8_21_14_0_10_40_38 TaxID=1974583 RepID=A0A2H0URS0_9BACT|nr:MAG: hypothetical protein COU07_02740 [Candidatus Harrisonbacteria bacterium CG10_big_fil_rev_8_21_14_0_10_40_38]